MATDLTVYMEDRPGTLADLGEALGEAGINIQGICGFPCEGRGVGHLLVEDPAAARAVIEAAGFEVGRQRDVIVMPIEDRPGVMGDIARRIAAVGVNVELLYLATATRAVIGADDLTLAKKVLEL
ncbi:MAG: ACT domain-containing protein [Acidimicrobiia bacterium]|nr:ACT domain-containing protein [Acidimicrobiia bacterium]